MELVKVENNELVVSKQLTQQIIEFEKAKKELEYQEKLLKEQLLELMPKYDKQNIILDGLSISYRKATTSKRLDTKRLKEELPDIYEQYSKDTFTNASIIIKVGD